MEIGARRLEISMLSRIGPDELLFRLTESSAGRDEQQLQQHCRSPRAKPKCCCGSVAGKSNREIGEILDISPRTVNKHLEQIFVKLGVENRASAAARAVRTLAR